MKALFKLHGVMLRKSGTILINQLRIFFVFYLLLFQQLNFAAMFLELAFTAQIFEITFNRYNECYIIVN